MANYPFCTIEPNIGVVAVPDPRLQALAALVKPEKVMPTAMEFLDIAGLVAGASKREGLGNQFLGHIRRVDAIAHVVRCFENVDITHVSGRVDPDADIQVIDTELMLADLESISKRHNSIAKKAVTGEKEARRLAPLYEKVMKGLEEGVPVRRQGLSPEERADLSDLFLMTAKPMLYVCNVGDAEMAIAQQPGQHPHVDTVRRVAQSENAEVVVICGAMEAEISELQDAEKADFLTDLGLKEPGLHRMIRVAYRLLGLITFLTAGPKEVRAWTVVRGAKAPEAAGSIHTDFMRGFIRAEVIAYDDFIACGGELQAKEQGKMRLEGKEYVIADGDVVHFRFNV
jgi:hypothetical protein